VPGEKDATEVSQPDSTFCEGWIWVITTINQGTGDATFEAGQTIVIDDLPGGVTYGFPMFDELTGVTGTENLSFYLGGDTMTIYTTGPVTIAPGGRIAAILWAQGSGNGVYSNPRSGGTAMVDPYDAVLESDESNNNYTDTVTVSDCPTGPTPTPTPEPTPEPTPTPNPGDCITVTLPSTAVAGPAGTAVTVPVSVSDLTGREVTSFDFKLEYDTNVLTFAEATKVGTLSSSYLITTFEETPGELVVSGFGTTDLAGAGVLLNLHFNVVGAPASCSTLEFEEFEFNEGTPCSTTTDGQACSVDRRISGVVLYANTEEPFGVPYVLMSAAGDPPVETGTDDIGAYYLSGFGPGSYTVTPSKSDDNGGITSYDAALVVQRVVGMITFTEPQEIVADVSGNGVITSFDAAQIARFAVGNPNTGASGEWRFGPTERSYPPFASPIVNQNYQAYLMGEVSGDWTPEDIPIFERTKRVGAEGTEPINVSLPHTTFGIGAVAVIPVSVSDLTGRGLIAHQFDIAYDPTIIMPDAIPVDIAGTLSNDFLLAYNVATPGLLRIGVYGINDLAGAGTLLKLRFIGVGTSGSVSGLSFVNFMFNENVDISILTDGSATILAPTSAGVEVSGMVRTPDGRGLRNAVVTMTDAAGNMRTAVTSTFGYYRFEDVAVGENYTMGVRSRTHRFTPRVVQVVDTLTDVDFVGLE
jgi:hypothetical protein